MTTKEEYTLDERQLEEHNQWVRDFFASEEELDYGTRPKD